MGLQVNSPPTIATALAERNQVLQAAGGGAEPATPSPLAQKDQAKVLASARAGVATTIGIGIGIPAGAMVAKVLANRLELSSPGATGALAGLVAGLAASKVAYKTKSTTLGAVAGGVAAAGAATAWSVVTHSGVPALRTLGVIAAAGTAIGLLPAMAAKSWAK